MKLKLILAQNYCFTMNPALVNTSHLQLKDSESEFGSLNSIKIGDDDSDSCIGQKPITVAAGTPCTSSIAK